MKFALDQIKIEIFVQEIVEYQALWGTCSTSEEE